MQIKNFLLCLMVYLFPICLDAQIPGESSTAKGKLVDSTSTITDTGLTSQSDSVENLAAIQVDNYPDNDEEETKMFLLIVGIIGFGVMLICIGIGAVLATLAFLTISTFVFLGVITASLYTGLRKRSLSRGANTFIRICSCLFGTISGGILAIVLNKMYHFASTGTSLAIGAVAGTLGGLVLAIFISRILKLLIKSIDKRFEWGVK